MKKTWISGRTDKMINCRFMGDDETSDSGEISAKQGEILPSQCWPIKTKCEHGIEISFSARNFKDQCVDRNAFDVYAHYDGEYTV